MKNLNLLSVLFLFFLLCNCSPIRTGATKSGKKLYESFYVGEEGVQYFIKPLEFISSNNRTLYIDFTFRYKDSVNNQNTTINYTIETPTPVENISQMEIKNNSQYQTIKNIKRLFLEKKGKNYIYRFSSSLPLSDVNKLFQEKSWIIITKNEKEEETYNSTKNTQKKLDKLNEIIFSLM